MSSTCKIVADLLPLYIDEACSEESRAFVEAHLHECGECRELLEKMRSGGKADAGALSSLSSISGKVSRMRSRSVIKGLLIGIACCVCCTLLVGGYFALTQWNIVHVPVDRIQVSDVSMLSDGNIAFRFFIDDEYDLHKINCHITSDCVMYIQPWRSIIENKRDPEQEVGLFNIEYGVNINTAQEPNWNLDFFFSGDEQAQAIYIGTEEENILIWERGMELPMADEDLENCFMSH